MKNEELQRIFSIIGYRNLLKQLGVILKKSEKISTKGTVEHLHKVRVASRRARTILGIFKSSIKKSKFRIVHSRISKITESLGEARDIDVQIEFIKTRLKSEENKNFHPGLKFIIKQRKALRKEIQTEFDQNLLRLKKINVLDHLEDYFRIDSRKIRLTKKRTKEIIYHTSIISYLKKLNAQIVLLLPQTIDEMNKTELHLLRKKIKKLRYAFEVLSPYFPKGFDTKLKLLKNTQDILGTIHDMDVWNDYLSELILDQDKINGTGKPAGENIREGIEYLIAYCRDQRKINFDKYLSEQHQSNEQNFWEEILSFYKE